jgi:hypothetical protein
MYSIYKYCWRWKDATDLTRTNVMSIYCLVKPEPGAYIGVGVANIQICHYFDHSFLEEEKPMIHSFTINLGGN